MAKKVIKSEDELKKIDLQPLKAEVSTTESVTPSIPAKTTISSSATPPPITPTKRPRKLGWLKWVGLAALIFILLLGATGAFAYFFAKSLQPVLAQTSQDANDIITAFQAQDLIKAKEASVKLKTDLTDIQNKYNQIKPLSVIPVLGAYVSDGQHGLTAAGSGLAALDKLIVAIEPYSDLIGFKTEAKNLTAVTSIEDRIVFLVNTLGKISPQLESISGDINEVRNALDKIDPNRYPEEFMGKSIRAKIVGVQDSVNSFAVIISQAKPLIDLLPTLLGDPNEKTYMLLFQNDGELRPTGGFLTAYAFLKVNKGKITPLNSYNIYDLDDRFKKTVTPPDPIKKYLNENRWYLRNMNFSPDFKVSMDSFSKYVRDLGLPTIDGIIGLDTYLPVELLRELGPIGVGGWGNFSANNDSRCDCPQVVYILEDIISKPVPGVRLDRKAVLGPLMHSIMANAMGSPKAKWPRFLNIFLDAINQKHVLFYFFEEANQQAAESFNAAGRIRDYDYDYLHVNDSNFGGAKSDLFIKREVEQEIETTADKVTKKVTITYTNPRKGSNCNLEAGQLCLNGVYRDYVRLYVPKGSKLISVVGSEVKESTAEDLGKTVFDAFFTMRPESSSKLVFTYELPTGMSLSPYRLLIQKQPGVISVKHSISLDGRPKEIDLVKDTEVILE